MKNKLATLLLVILIMLFYHLFHKGEQDGQNRR